MTLRREGKRGPQGIPLAILAKVATEALSCIVNPRQHYVYASELNLAAVATEWLPLAKLRLDVSGPTRANAQLLPKSAPIVSSATRAGEEV